MAGQVRPRLGYIEATCINGQVEEDRCGPALFEVRRTAYVRLRNTLYVDFTRRSRVHTLDSMSLRTHDPLLKTHMTKWSR